MTRNVRRQKPVTVSVILPTYNRQDFILRALESVLNQSFQDFEVVVVDDGSEDETESRVASVADGRVTYVRLAEHRGAGVARNAGIERSKGRFLAFQDSDDEWLPEKLARQVTVLEEEPSVGVVYSDMYWISAEGKVAYHESPTVVPDRLVNPETSFYQLQKLGIQSAILRKECLSQVGGFNEELPSLEDLELFVRLSRRFRFHHIKTPLVRYHESDGLSKNPSAGVRARAMLLKLFKKELLKDHMDFFVREYYFLERYQEAAEILASLDAD